MACPVELSCFSTTQQPTPKKMSFFEGVAVAPPIEVFFMNKMYMDETDPNKVNLTVGGWLSRKLRNSVVFAFSSSC
ncbi:hypothetical protein COOONC_23355 [Cooperia oncophora]